MEVNIQLNYAALAEQIRGSSPAEFTALVTRERAASVDLLRLTGLLPGR